MRETREYTPDGTLLGSWEYTDEQDAQGNRIKHTAAHWVEKFGKAYFEPRQVAYRIIVYYPEETGETEGGTAPGTASSVTAPAQ